MRLYSRLYLVLVLALSSLVALTQEAITPASARHFSKQQLRDLIRESAFQAVKEHGVPRSIFDQQYPQIEKNLLVNVRPVLRQKFRWVESTGSNNNKGLYEKEIYRGVRDVIFSDPEYITLAILDQTDRILSFKSDIVVKEEGTLVVTERIKIYNGEGNQTSLYMNAHPDGSSSVNNDIQRGITRDFPTLYSTDLGLNVTVPFDVKRVLRNGTPEPHSLIEHDNGVTIRVGSADVFIEQGIHEYTIEYETRFQIIFHESKDELYWNVNGNGWVFTVDTVACKITFPAGARIFEQACYTGNQGSDAKDCKSKILSDNSIAFETNQRQDSYQGLTVAAAIQKGILIPPSKAERYLNLAKANWPIYTMIAVVLSLFGINFVSWRKWGKDPSRGTIIPHFDAPDGISPADAGFIYEQKYKPEQFSAALVDIAVRKGIRILIGEEGIVFKSKTYSFVGGEHVRKMESYVAKTYGWAIGSITGITATKTYNSQIASLNTQLNTHLESHFRSDSVHYKGTRGFFALNSGAGTWGFILLVILGILAIALSHQLHTVTVAIILAIIFAVGFVMQFVFYKIMPSYNAAGRKILDHILGLRMYLVTAEERRFDKLQPPEKNLDLFEKFLPYAIALECPSEWSNKFEKILADAAAGGNYKPGYYSGDYRDFSNIGSDLSSGLSGTISSASTEPSSSSSGGGSSGGGSSGGGGGGGGGGGW